MKPAIVLMILTILCGCEGGNSPSTDTAKNTAGNIVYVQDSRSGLCFAEVTSQSYPTYNVVSIANVPCAPVSALLVK